MDDNAAAAAAAEELLAFLNPERLRFEGREGDVPEGLRRKVVFVRDLDSAIEHYRSPHGIDAFVGAVERLEGEALGVIGGDKGLEATRAGLQERLFSFPWGELPADDDTGAMLNIGDNTEAVLAATMYYRLAFGRSGGGLLERCVLLLERGFLPFGYDQEKDLLFAYSRPAG